MIAKIVLALAGLAVAVALVRAVVSGQIQFGSGPSGMKARRATEPSSYWTIFVIGCAVVCYITWLLVD